MSKIIIAVDVDEVLFPLKEKFYDYVNRNSRKRGIFNLFREASRQNIDWKNPHYEFCRELEELDDEKRVELFHEFSQTKYFKNMQPLPGARQGIDALLRHGELHAITARQNYLRTDTKRALDIYFPKKFSGIEIGNHHNHFDPNNKKTKKKMCKDICANILIEDQVGYALEVSRSIPVILFDQPWNRGFEADNIYRVGNWENGYEKSWQDVVEKTGELVEGFSSQNKKQNDQEVFREPREVSKRVNL